MEVISKDKDKDMSKVVGEITSLSEIVFLPNPNHRMAKARFWARYDDILGGSEDISLSLAQQVTKDSRLKKWWGQPGFQEWFKNRDETRERLEYLYQIALDSAESVLLDPEANDNAKVQMVKVIAHLAGKNPDTQKKVEDGLPDDPEKLRAFIIKNSQRLLDDGKKTK